MEEVTAEQHMNKALDNIKSVFSEACLIIEALKPGEKIAATKLAETLAEKFKFSFADTGPALYPTLKFLFTGYPNVVILRGAHGGIKKLAPSTVTPVALVETTSVNTETEVKASSEDTVVEEPIVEDIADTSSSFVKEDAPIINT